jgi:uncharacterized repeat protein (TIGR03803 family)
MRLKPPSLIFSLIFITWTAFFAGELWAAPKYKILHAFTGGADGGGLFGSLALDESGNLYGITRGGGKHIYGLVFELSPSSKYGWKETVLHNFCSVRSKKGLCLDGAGGWYGPVLAPSGDLYGSTTAGGSSNQGVVFQLARVGRRKYKVIYEGGSNGGWITDMAGNLYGFIGPGEYKDGAVAELSPAKNGWTYKALYNFDISQGDGWTPESGLNFDSSGNLYGTTKFGGSGGFGTAFEVSPPDSLGTPSEWQEHILHQFPAFQGDGEYPYAGLIADQAGNVYGATQSGGACYPCGTVFELSPGSDGTWQETILHKFSSSSDGIGPLGTLVFDGAGNLYGTTIGGGNGQQYCGGGCGVVFQLTPGAHGDWKYTVLHRFNGTDGAGPQAALILDSKGNLYGTTQYGGSGSAGVAFELTP